MLTERLQILVSTDQRRRLEAEAKRRGSSVGSLIREAVDARYGAVTTADRLQALAGIRGLQGRFVDPEEVNRIGESEREQQLETILATRGR